MGTQKNHLSETVLLSIQAYMKTDGKENIHNFMLKNLVYLDLGVKIWDKYLTNSFS